MKGRETKHRKLIKVFLFISALIFVSSINKSISGSPIGDLDQLARNILSFVLASLVTGGILIYASAGMVKIIAIVFFITGVLMRVFL